MNKNYKSAFILFISLSFLAIAANAQPVLTSANSAPMGTKTFGYNITGNVTHTAAGASQTWDYSAVAYDATTFYFEEVPYSSLSQQTQDSFPLGNNVSKYVLNGNLIAHIVGRMQSSFQATLGLAFSTGYQIYAVPDTFLTIPMHYQDTFDKREYDAYGTLTTPFGTYTNVVRIKEDLALAATPSNKFRYLYFQFEPYYNILMEYQVEKTTLEIDGKNFYNLDLSTSIFSANVEDNIQISPNPFNSQIIVKGSQLEYAVLYDLTGKEIVCEQILLGNQTKINTSKVLAGIYILKVGNRNFKVLKQ